jgi:hypothetical protein
MISGRLGGALAGQPSSDTRHGTRRWRRNRVLVKRRLILVLAQIWCDSDRADQTSLEKINLGPAVHLAFDELELGDLTFCLAIRPRQADSGADRNFVFGDAAGERSDQA